GARRVLCGVFAVAAPSRHCALRAALHRRRALGAQPAKRDHAPHGVIPRRALGSRIAHQPIVLGLSVKGSCRGYVYSVEAIMSSGCRVLGFVAIVVDAAGGIGCTPAESSSTEQSAHNLLPDQSGENGAASFEVCNHSLRWLYHDFRDQDGNWLGG